MAEESTEAEVVEYLADIPADEQEALKTCYAKGDPMPSGYMDAVDWANAQLLHGLRQKWCVHGCRRVLFPQEVAGHVCRALEKKQRASSRSDQHGG